MPDLDQTVKTGAEVGMIQNMIPAIFNLIQLLKLITLCCDGKSDFAEAKCKESILDFKVAANIIFMAKDLWPLKIAVFDYIINAYMDSNDPRFMKKPEEEVGEDENPEGDKDSDFAVLLIIIEILIDDFDQYLGLDGKHVKKTKLRYPNGNKIPMTELNERYIFGAALDFIRATLQKKTYAVGSVELKFYVLGAKVAALFYAAKEKKHKHAVLALLRYMHDNADHSKYLDSVKHPAKRGRANQEIL